MSQADKDRYYAALHAMQSGVAATQPDQPTNTLKHLRVGVNSAMAEHSGLVRLLLAKNIITLDEYEKAIADAMEREVKVYEEELSKLHGASVRLA